MKLTLLLVLTALLYIPATKAPFVYEDQNWLLDVQPGARHALQLSPFPSRSLTLQTYQWQSDPTTGWANPTEFHGVNVAIHLFAGVLVYALLRRCSLSQVACFVATFVFLAHPLQSQAVSYVSARSDLLMTLFVLGALLCVTVRGSVAVVGMLACLVLAALSKEIGIIGGALVVLTALLLERWRYAAILTGAGIVAGLLVLPRLAFITPAWASWREDVALQVTGVARILGLFVWPSGFTIDPDPAAVSLAGHAVSLALLVGLVALVWLLHRIAPLVAWGLAVALVSLLPRVLVPNGEPIQEQHAYLAMVGLSGVVGLGIARLFQKDPAHA